MSGAIQLTLERDGHDQPWGFRLQGGHDVGLPLSIQRVLVGTPAEGVLRKGDVILRIGQTETKGLTHQQAADLFTKAGNQILIHLKRAGATAGQATKNVTRIPAPQSVPITDGIPLHGLHSTSPASSPETLLSNLPKSRSAPTSHQASTTTHHPLTLTIQNQPYRTSPLIQPSAKIDLGPGSAQHLKMQAEYITGTKESQPLPDLKQAKEFEMKQKVTGTLQHLQHTPAQNTASEPVTNYDHRPAMSSQPVNVPAKQFYNNPINLYSNENIAEVAKLNQMGVSGAPKGATPSSPTGLIHPNKPHQVVLNPSKEYNPKASATWQALQESDPGIDPAKYQSYSSLKEHDPVFSEVYSAPKNAQFAPYHKTNSPQNTKEGGSRIISKSGNVSNSQQGRCSAPSLSTTQAKSPIKSPVANLLPSSFGGKASDESKTSDVDSEQQQSSVLLAALAEDDSRPKSASSLHQIYEMLPLFETNSIGGTRRIAQSSSFNKLMMDVLGE